VGGGERIEIEWDDEASEDATYEQVVRQAAGGETAYVPRVTFSMHCVR
jgi:hypothetical protein